jgi:hypothetical protein
MENKTMPITGGCMCGAIRYEATEPPQRVGLLPLPDVPEMDRQPILSVCDVSERRIPVHTGRAEIL